MSHKIPAIVSHRVSDHAKQTLDAVAKFVEEDCLPADPVYISSLNRDASRWHQQPTILQDLKVQARRLGLWNMFLPVGQYVESAGFSTVEYGLMAEWLGKSRVASEAMNCSAPDTGNMEVLAKYGDDLQKKEWLEPLLGGEIRSAFLMTEPDVASSDARNVKMSVRREGNEWVLNGSKWWSSGAGDPRCKLYIVLGQTSPNAPAYRQQSIILVPCGTPGVTIERMLSVYGYDDAPHGHGHMTFRDVRVPLSNIVLGEGRGFEIIQGRLGPGRIHHAMRTIGAAERALDWMLMRINDPRRSTFGAPLLSAHGVILDWVARSRLEIDSARLVVLNAAVKMDDLGPKAALAEIAQAKVLVPSMALTVIDRAVQAFGGAGVSQDTPLANMWAQIRTLRFADGPDEVHLAQMGRNENKRGKEATDKILEQMKNTELLMTKYGVKNVEIGSNIQQKNSKL